VLTLLAGELLRQTLHVLSDETLDAPPGVGWGRDADGGGKPASPPMPARTCTRAPAARWA